MFQHLFKRISKQHVVAILVVIAAATWKFAPGDKSGELQIQDYRNSHEPQENLSAHKPYDVEVFRTTFMNGAYQMRFYQQEGDSLRSHGSLYVGSEDFDKAGYKWLNDSCVVFTLINSGDHSKKEIKVWGKGKNSSMSID